MDTSAEQSVTTDALGRRSGPRRQYSIEEKRQIVQETHVRGASVAVVARRHDLKPNQVFAWRRLHRQGLLKADAAQASTELLPVKVSTPTVIPSERVTRAHKRSTPDAVVVPCIEIKLANGHGLIVRGDVEVKQIARVIELLVRR